MTASETGAARRAASPADPAHAALEAARALAPEIRGRAPEAERLRTLPPDGTQLACAAPAATT